MMAKEDPYEAPAGSRIFPKDLKQYVLSYPNKNVKFQDQLKMWERPPLLNLDIGMEVARQPVDTDVYK